MMKENGSRSVLTLHRQEEIVAAFLKTKGVEVMDVENADGSLTAVSYAACHYRPCLRLQQVSRGVPAGTIIVPSMLNSMADTRLFNLNIYLRRMRWQPS